jgi:hypothetical protein
MELTVKGMLLDDIDEVRVELADRATDVSEIFPDLGGGSGCTHRRATASDPQGRAYAQPAAVSDRGVCGLLLLAFAVAHSILLRIDHVRTRAAETTDQGRHQGRRRARPDR